MPRRKQQHPKPKPKNTTPADVLRIAEKARRDAEKGRHKRGDSR